MRAPPNHFGYSEEEFASLCQQAVAFMRPLLSAPPATVVFPSSPPQIREGVVMTSCTLSVIPSFQSLVAPFIRVVPPPLSLLVVARRPLAAEVHGDAAGAHLPVHQRSLLSPAPPQDYHDRTGSLAPDHSAALETVLRTTVDRQSLYMTKLNALLETRAALLPVFLAPALRFRVTPLVQRCLGAMTELTEPAQRALAELTRRTMAEVAAAAAATDFDAERASSYETLLVTVVGSAGFLLTVLNASFFAFGEVVLAEVAAVCEGSYEAVCDAICKETCDETCEGTCKEIYKETCKEICKETCKEICKETCKEICKEISKETSKDTCKNTCKNTCKETTDERTTLARLLLLLHLVFGSAIHLRKAIVQQRAQQEQLSVAHSRLTERVLQVAVRLASRLSHATALAVVVNFASELMIGFVCKWKELYRSNDLLMNANVKVAGTRLVSIYGENPVQVIYYLPSYLSYAAFHKLFQFLLALTRYNNYRNPQAFAGAMDFVAIAVFERIFGVAYLQRLVEKQKTPVNWRRPGDCPKDWQCSLESDDWLQKNGVSLVELPYLVSESMKASGKTEYYKATGKTRLVFMMVGCGRESESQSLLTCLFPHEMLIKSNTSSLVQKVLFYVLRRDSKDRSMFVGEREGADGQLTEDYACIIANVCSYCDVCRSGRRVRRSHLHEERGLLARAGVLHPPQQQRGHAHPPHRH